MDQTRLDAIRARCDAATQMTHDEIVHVYENSKMRSGYFQAEAVTAAYVAGLAALHDNARLRAELEAARAEAERLRAKNAAYKADVEAGRLVRLPDFPQDMDDILEPLKVQSALNSEVMKLNFRKEHRPKDVSILDYTIIAALHKQLDDAENAALKETAADRTGLDATQEISEWRNLAGAALDKQMSLIQESIKCMEHVRRARRQRDAWRKRAEIANNPVIRGQLDEAMFIPEIVCLCGSMRFYNAFRKVEYELELQGKITLTPSFKPGVAEHGGMVGITQTLKEALDDLHKRKIYISDRVLILNVGGYIGESTRSEIQYAESLGKPVDYLEKRAALERGKEGGE